MKRLLTIAIIFASPFTSFSQSLGYEDLGILFSRNDNNGTARFTAMGGAFGALGGDISSININPAGLSIYNSSVFSGTLNSRNSNTTANYYGNAVHTENEFINLSQAGAALVFDNVYAKEWTKFALGFNYRITTDFNDSFRAEGNSGVATFTNFPDDNSVTPINYSFADEQRFVNNYSGETGELNIAFSAVHQNKLHLGLSFNLYDLNFRQQNTLSEFNNDGNGETLDAFLYQESFITASGLSANLGFIYKLHPNFRFGLSYQTPTWYTEVIEETNIVSNDGFDGDVEIFAQNGVYDNTARFGFRGATNLYRLKTPSTLTASGALIIGKFGLLSMDYSIRNFRNIRYSAGPFSFDTENQSFQDNYRNTHNLNLGTEWRFNRFSLRGGYVLQQNPDKQALESDNFKQYSVGAGYNFGSFKLDFSYSDSNQTAPYNFYAGFNVNPAELNLNNKIFTGTITFNL